MSHSDNVEKLREDIREKVLAELVHELKNPLATIIGSLEIYTFLRERITSEKRAALIESALAEARRLNHFLSHYQK